MDIRTNPNRERLEEAVKALESNGGYRVGAERTSENRCICAEFLDDAQDGYKGECSCGRYVAV